MSRRQSRVSIDVRQNDTLLEFENFKKKFLLANKHITKLNSTLSVRIEELNAQISTLYVENLRLRASEIALASQLKKEREKSRKIIADTEAATHSFIKHLSHIRKSFHVPHSRPSDSEDSQSPPPRAKRPVINPDASPAPNRLARAPTVPGIVEDDETNASSPEDPDADVEEEEEEEKEPTPVKRKKTKSRSSDSRLPIAVPPLPDIDVRQIEFEEQLSKVGKRKPTRRQSGLLTSVSITTVTPSGFSTELVPPRPPSPAFGSPIRREVGLAEEADERRAANGEEDEDEVEVILQSVAKREKKEKERKKERTIEKDRDKDRYSSSNSERTKERERKRTRDPDDPALVAEGSKSKLKDVTNSHPICPTLLEIDDDRERQLTPEDDVPLASTSSQTNSATRPRDGVATPAPKPRSHPAPVLPPPRSSSPQPPPAPPESEAAGGRERRVRKSVNYAEPKLNTKMRKPDPQPLGTTKRMSTSSIDGVRSRTSSAEATGDEPPSGTAQDTVPSGATVKRKKSRVYVPSEDGEESEGTQADAEFGGLTSWVNVDGRRRSIQSGSSGRRVEGDDARRHSMAV
ncbi:uncharacterized protein C8Q71DRAFT_202796 [Rhodofomes roseus]|uniref:Shugoshin C-terminal domain-containing protein n=1 Tax=Rhodofomes roseus TaxID=34475 RepID=A0ABQ8KTP6_9APHY|nr:uncharacterized protein C8Q71DRAFT_202796 [Rhodofomes roseus]KAH9842430.1 hypothetical protein C8Q71DRAFT_202796 [Rhodofomes roseus]